MAETAQTMTEFTYAPGEKNIVGDRFSPSVSILEKDKLMSLAQEIQTRVFTDADQLRHEESMHMAEKQYTRADQQRAHPTADARQPADASRAADSGSGTVRAKPAGRVTSSKNRKEDRAEKSKSALSFRLIR